MLESYLTNFSQVQILLLSIFGLIFIVQIVYTIFFFIKLRKISHQNSSRFNKDISVIICAKNEKKNIPIYLPKILKQKYPNFEVIVVNDASWDNTLDLLEELQEKFNHLKIVNNSLNERGQGKKMALTLGIKAASNEYLVLTDADCDPSSEYWLQEIANNFQDKDIIIGYSPFKKTKGFLNYFLRFDGFYAGVQYLSYALAGLPYMGTGRNLAYTKSVYNKVGGFKSHYHILSGDDDLLVNQVATSENTSVQVSSNSLMVSLTKENFKDYFWQKKRHFLTAKHYKLKDKILLGIHHTSNFAFYIFFFVLLFHKNLFLLAISAFILRYFLQVLLLLKPSKTMKSNDLIWVFPFMEVLLLVLHPVIYWSNRIIKHNRWK